MKINSYKISRCNKMTNIILKLSISYDLLRVIFQNIPPELYTSLVNCFNKLYVLMSYDLPNDEIRENEIQIKLLN